MPTDNQNAPEGNSEQTPEQSGEQSGDCKDNRKKLVTLDDAFRCCDAQLGKVQMVVGRASDFFKAMFNAGGSVGRQNVLESFGFSNASELQSSAVIPAQSVQQILALLATMAPSARTPGIGFIPGYTPREGVEMLVDKDGNVQTIIGYAAATDYNSLLSAATAVLAQTELAVRRKRERKDCCACLEPKCLGQDSKAKRGFGKYRSRIPKL